MNYRDNVRTVLILEMNAQQTFFLSVGFTCFWNHYLGYNLKLSWSKAIPLLIILKAYSVWRAKIHFMLSDVLVQLSNPGKHDYGWDQTYRLVWSGSSHRQLTMCPDEYIWCAKGNHRPLARCPSHGHTWCMARGHPQTAPNCKKSTPKRSFPFRKSFCKEQSRRVPGHATGQPLSGWLQPMVQCSWEVEHWDNWKEYFGLL